MPRKRSPLVRLVAPDLFQKAALFKIVYKAVVVDFFRFFSDRSALFTGKRDGFGDRLSGDYHGAVEDLSGIDIVSGLQRLGILGAHGFADRRFGFVGILFDEVDNFGKGRDHALNDLGPLAQHFVTGMKRAVDERDVQIDQPVHDVVAFVLGADVERRRDNDAVDDTGRHGLIAFALTAADGPDRHRFRSQAQFLYDRA